MKSEKRKRKRGKKGKRMKAIKNSRSHSQLRETQEKELIDAFIGENGAEIVGALMAEPNHAAVFHLHLPGFREIQFGLRLKATTPLPGGGIDAALEIGTIR
jgi:hypothetical protein